MLAGDASGATRWMTVRYCTTPSHLTVLVPATTVPPDVSFNLSWRTEQPTYGSPRKPLASRRRRREAAPATAGHLPRSAVRSEACRQCATRYGSSNATVGSMREHEAATATIDIPGKVTIPGKLSDNVGPRLWASIMTQAGLRRRSR